MFARFYERLAVVLSVTSYSHHLVAAKVLTTHDEEQLDGLDNSNKRAAFVLRKVAVHLKNGNSECFHALLSVIETYGDISSFHLVSDIKSGIMTFTGSQKYYTVALKLVVVISNNFEISKTLTCWKLA